ncbi:unnamed protein product [Callosobruchus maculatus]|uniref:Uncharacterized protein n=1 Tax=Callosobruchus maculatus TaxID=64391 RepID=A0A653C8I8_CALMS|nr:unnamed protein product [Callosobruchus maculatus]
MVTLYFIELCHATRACWMRPTRIGDQRTEVTKTLD